jgi:hypothetical protein
MLRAAFTSRSWVTPQVHVHTRTFGGIAFCRVPQVEQSLVEGNHRSTHHAWLGNIAHAMAALRNLTIALIRLAGHSRIKQIMERHHADKIALLNASRP